MQCTNCSGDKKIVTQSDCPLCNGWGYIETDEQCSSCEASGTVDGERCTSCGGSGHIAVREDCHKSVDQEEDCPLCEGTGQIPDPVDVGTQFYCRFFNSLDQEIACSGNFSSEDDCASAARAADAYGYGWTMKPCGS